MSLNELIEKEATLAEFLRAFARQYYMLCEGQDKVELAREFIEDVEIAQSELNALIALSDKEKQERTDAFNVSLKELDEDFDESAPSEKSVARMANLANRHWGRRDLSPELEGVLYNASTFLSNLIYVAPSSVMTPRSVDEWHSEQIEIANRRLQWTIRELSQAEDDVKESNAALDAIEEL